MAKNGVQLLPPVISEQQMIDIYKILAKVNLQIGTMKSDFSHSIVASPLVSIFFILMNLYNQPRLKAHKLHF